MKGKEFKYPYTKFGEFLVSLLEEHGESVCSMAAKLHVSSQFLSNVLHGRKGVPADWVPRLSRLYHLSDEAKADMAERIAESQTFYAVTTKHASSVKRKAAAQFVKCFAAICSLAEVIGMGFGWMPFAKSDEYDFSGPHTAKDVARYIIGFCTRQAMPIDSLQLQAVLYCVQAAFLRSEHRALFADEIEAWPQGPVVRNVYRAYCGYGAAAIYEEKEPDEPFSKYEEQLMDTVILDKMGDGWMLMQKGRMPGSPWSIAYEDGRRNVIPKDVIAEYEEG